MPSDQYDMVCLGGGVAAGYWAEEMVALIKSGARSTGVSPKLKICIISSYPEGLAPYERSELSKECLRPSDAHHRDWQAWGNKTFPYTSQGNDREPRSARWYKENDVTMLGWCECYEADVANGTLKLLQYSDRNRTKAKAKRLSIVYGSLLVATGSSPKRLHGDAEAPCFCVRHPDLRGARIEKQERYGLGSAHYLRDVGDCIKLVKALGTSPPTAEAGDAGSEVSNTVALVGGGLLCIEVAAAIVSYFPGVRPLLLVAKSRLMPEFFSNEMSDFYEERLTEAGVRIEKGVRGERLWGLEEQGEFETLGGERAHFGPAPRGFTECRGVVVRGDDGKLKHVPARVVFIGIGSVPNSELFRTQLELLEDGGISVDSQCRARQPAPAEDGAIGASWCRPVFAAGDVAAYPLSLEGGRRVRHEHVQNARDMAIVAARNMLETSATPAGSVAGAICGSGTTPGKMYNALVTSTFLSVPNFSSRFLDLSWRFYGVPEGKVVVLGESEFRTTRTFGAFWVRGERVVGAFLEGGTMEQQIAVAQLTRLRPKVFSARILKGSQLGDFLEDPGSIEAADESDFTQLLMCCRCV
ncbi:unnamed protein product [Ascophyllum nodosum]